MLEKRTLNLIFAGKNVGKTMIGNQWRLYKMPGGIVEIWFGDRDDPASEYVTGISEHLVPQLIVALQVYENNH